MAQAIRRVAEAATRWLGESMDFGLAVEALLQRSESRHSNVTSVGI